MIDLKTVFFPDIDYELIAAVCYIIVLIAAYERFNSLVKDYSAYNAPSTARPWTTYLRYHAAAAVYSCFYLMLFTLIYQIFHKYPALVDIAESWINFGKNTDDLIQGIGNDLKLISPILTLLLLAWGFEKFGKTGKLDKNVRAFLHKVGSIPSAVIILIRKMKRYELNMQFEECSKEFSEILKNEVKLLKNDQNSMEHLFERTCHLYTQINNWESLTSEFYNYHMTYRQSLESIKVLFTKVGRLAERYYRLKSKFRKDAQLYAQLAEAKPELKLESMHPKIITELKRDLRNDLKDLLENIYIYIACAVHSKGRSESKRHQLLKSIGFVLPETREKKRVGIDPNDLTILFMFLIFVIPVAGIFAYFISGGKFYMKNAFTYFVWSLMALAVGLLSVVIPTICKHARETFGSRFWRFMKPPNSRHAWFSYLVSSIVVGVASIISMILLSYLTPNLPSYEFLKIAQRIIPWGLVPFAVSFLLCYHLDRKTAKKYTFVVEASTTSLAAIAAGVLSLILSANIVEWNELVKRMYFSIPAAALLGFIIGAVFPYRYRLQAKKPIELIDENVDLKSIIENCTDKFKVRAAKEHIDINMSVADDMPNLIIDPNRFEQVITSLIANAIEFTPEYGKVGVSAELVGRNGIRLTVNDNGIGMADDDVDAVVNASKERLSAAWLEGEEREDADLYQIKTIAEEHGGKFNLRSQPLKGTEVMIELPEARLDKQYKVPENFNAA